ALVHLDPVLDPVDSRVFAVLWLWAKHEGRGATAFPSYPTLLARCNVQSRATLARSLAILRITRWVTLCRRVRDQNGRNRGNIYALHE
ncbi:MAG: STY4528 family pathogenicity island replication protein, partial [Gammaproteobacteria bacterium]